MKWLSLIASVIVGGGLATAAAVGVISSNTAAPSHNPAGGGTKVATVQYGTNK